MEKYDKSEFAEISETEPKSSLLIILSYSERFLKRRKRE